MMLNFYGLRLVDETTGEIERCPHIWQNRYKNLIEHSHNFLRISTYYKLYNGKVSSHLFLRIF